MLCRFVSCEMSRAEKERRKSKVAYVIKWSKPCFSNMKCI